MLFFKDQKFFFEDFEENCCGDPSTRTKMEFCVNRNKTTNQIISIVIQNNRFNQENVKFILNETEFEIDVGCAVEIFHTENGLGVKIINFPL